MAITKEKKKAIIAKVKEAIDASKSLVFVHFKGLSVLDTTELRRILREQEVGYTVAKKTLIARALNDASFEGTRPTLEGEIAIAYADDLLSPAREIHSFAKKHKDNLTIVGGIFDGVYKSKDEMKQIALIPSRETLYAQFLNSNNYPIQGLAVSLNAIAEKKS